MNKIYFKLLFFIHKVMQLIGAKPKHNPVIKVWWDEETQNTCMYANVRSGVYHMPIGRECKEGNMVYSYWLASFHHIHKYGIDDKKNNKTIYTLYNVKKRDEN